MKLMIWQQFSSNHSGSYTILAVFPSAEAAKEAQIRIEKLLLDIREWYAEDESRLYGDVSDFSPVEEEIAKEYQIN